MIIIMGYAKTAPGDLDRLAGAMTAMVSATNAEDGCELYCFSRDVTDPDTLIISERWRDQAAVDAHFKTLHMSTFNAALSSATVSALIVKAYENGEVRTLMGS
jgi:quinol monooxygenase YgiN